MGLRLGFGFGLGVRVRIRARVSECSSNEARSMRHAPG